MTKILRLLAIALLTASITVGPVLAATIEELQKPFLDLVRAKEAHTITKGEGVVVAVIDTGVDAGHPDLAGAFLPGYHVNKDSAEAANSDPDGHGTKMSGIIAARGGGFNNALGIAPKTKILPVAMDFEGDVSATLTKAIRWAADNGATVLNLSLARPATDTEPLSTAEREAVAYAQSKDAVVIVGAGNTKDLTGGNNLAGLPGVLAVGGTTAAGEPWSGSEVREYVSISAPGKDIVGAAARNIHATGYSSSSGTSDAAAIVSGVAALIRAKHPELDAANVINRLIKTAVEKGEPGRDPVYGFGIVDAYAALTADVPTVTENPLGVATTAPDSDAASVTQSSYSVAADIMGILIRLAILGAVIFGVVLIVRARKRRNTGQTPASALPPPATPLPQAEPTIPPSSPFNPPTSPAYPPTGPMATPYNPNPPPAAPVVNPPQPQGIQFGSNTVVEPPTPPNQPPLPPQQNQDPPTPSTTPEP